MRGARLGVQRMPAQRRPDARQHFAHTFVITHRVELGQTPNAMIRFPCVANAREEEKNCVNQTTDP